MRPLWAIIIAVMSFLTKAQAQEDKLSDVLVEAPAVSAPTACVVPKLPAHFHVDEIVADAGWSFEVMGANDKTSYGDVSESLMNFERKLTWKWKSTKEAVGVKAAISWGQEIAITDCNGQKIAELKERLFAGWIHNKYYILDAKGKIVGKSYKAPSLVNAFGTPEFEIRSADNKRTLVTIKRPVFSWG